MFKRILYVIITLIVLILMLSITLEEVEASDVVPDDVLDSIIESNNEDIESSEETDKTGGNNDGYVRDVSSYEPEEMESEPSEESDNNFEIDSDGFPVQKIDDGESDYGSDDFDQDFVGNEDNNSVIKDDNVVGEKDIMEIILSFVATFSIVIFVIMVLILVCLWKIFVKADVAGWKAIIPIYGAYLLWKIATGNGLFFILSIIPVINIFSIFFLYWKLNKAFNGNVITFFMMIFLPVIAFPIIAFDKGAVYVGPLAQQKNE